MMNTSAAALAEQYVWLIEEEHLVKLEGDYLEAARRYESCECRTCKARESRAFEAYVEELERIGQFHVRD